MWTALVTPRVEQWMEKKIVTAVISLESVREHTVTDTNWPELCKGANHVCWHSIMHILISSSRHFHACFSKFLSTPNFPVFITISPPPACKKSFTARIDAVSFQHYTWYIPCILYGAPVPVLWFLISISRNFRKFWIGVSDFILAMTSCTFAMWKHPMFTLYQFQNEMWSIITKDAYNRYYIFLWAILVPRVFGRELTVPLLETAFMLAV